MAERTIRHGRNVKRIREIQGIRQETPVIELEEPAFQAQYSGGKALLRMLPILQLSAAYPRASRIESTQSQAP